MIAFLLFLILAVLALYCTSRLVNAVVCGIFRAVVAFVRLPWYLWLAFTFGRRVSGRMLDWAERRYVEAERRARGV